MKTEHWWRTNLENVQDYVLNYSTFFYFCYMLHMLLQYGVHSYVISCVHIVCPTVDSKSPEPRFTSCTAPCRWLWKKKENSTPNRIARKTHFMNLLLIAWIAFLTELVYLEIWNSKTNAEGITMPYLQNHMTRFLCLYLHLTIGSSSILN
jgi:hypothetical protein